MPRRVNSKKTKTVRKNRKLRGGSLTASIANEAGKLLPAVGLVAARDLLRDNRKTLAKKLSFKKKGGKKTNKKRRTSKK